MLGTRLMEQLRVHSGTLQTPGQQSTLRIVQRRRPVRNDYLRQWRNAWPKQAFFLAT